MSFYRDEIARLNKALYPHDDLTKQIIQSKLFIDKHFSENINLDKIASKALVSKFHFIRLFKNIYNKTPHQYLTEVRINKAKQLLKAGKKVEDVCYLVGFRSIGSFKVLFKRHTKKTPVFYKQYSRTEQVIPHTPFYYLPLYCFFQNSNFQDGQ